MNEGKSGGGREEGKGEEGRIILAQNKADMVHHGRVGTMAEM